MSSSNPHDESTNSLSTGIRWMVGFAANARDATKEHGSVRSKTMARRFMMLPPLTRQDTGWATEGAPSPQVRDEARSVEIRRGETANTISVVPRLPTPRLSGLLAFRGAEAQG